MKEFKNSYEKGLDKVKKIVFVNSSLTQGGSERAMSLIANGCANSGMDVTMLLLRDKKRTYFLEPGIQCIQLRYRHKNKGLMLAERIRVMRKIIKDINPDTVVSFMTDINIFTIIACLGLDVRTIISERLHPLLGADGKSKKPFITRMLRRILYPSVDKIVFQTNLAQRCFSRKIQQLGVIIPNPISPDLPPVYEGKRSKVIVAAGRLKEQKNFGLLIEAFAEVCKEYSEYKLVIYGQGEQLTELQNLTQELNIVDKVQFPGFISDIHNQIRDAAIYVSSSNFEGISNSMLEAAAMGIPSICTDCPVGGAAMVIKHNTNGLLVPVGDVGALYRAIKTLIDNSNLAESYSKEAIKLRDEFSIERIGQMWIDIV